MRAYARWDERKAKRDEREAKRKNRGKIKPLSAIEKRHIRLNAGRIRPYAIATLLGRSKKMVAKWIFNNCPAQARTRRNYPIKCKPVERETVKVAQMMGLSRRAA